jgi:hypothetical protein
MPSDTESAVVAFFHASRAAAKRARKAKPPTATEARMLAIIVERARYEALAAQDDYERTLD